MKLVTIRFVRPLRHSTGIAALSSLALTSVASAQVATVAAEGALVAATSESVQAEGQSQAATSRQSDPVSADEGGSDDFWHRYGVADRSDPCPALAGVAPDGCPRDGDGLSGADDRCPDQAETKNGFEDADGCPDELPASVESFAGVIAGIEFDNAQASIDPRRLESKGQGPDGPLTTNDSAAGRQKNRRIEFRVLR